MTQDAVHIDTGSTIETKTVICTTGNAPHRVITELPSPTNMAESTSTPVSKRLNVIFQERLLGILMAFGPLAIVRLFPT